MHYLGYYNEYSTCKTIPGINCSLLFLAAREVHLKVNAGDCHRWSANELASGRDMTFLAVLPEDFINVCSVPYAYEYH